MTLEQMPVGKSEILITRAPLETVPQQRQESAGAVVDFWGVVRGLEDRRKISGIEYEAHEPMAQHQMQVITNAAARQFSAHEIILRHRIGFVEAGEASLFLRVSSAHRQAAFAASQWIVSELKRKVPIWKRPIFSKPAKVATLESPLVAAP